MPADKTQKIYNQTMIYLENKIEGTNFQDSQNIKNNKITAQPAVRKQTTKNQIDIVQRAATHCISGAISSRPNEALNVILYFPSLEMTGKS